MDENTNNDQNTFYEVHLRKTVEERTITEFPRPYNYDCSPHGEMNFSYRIHSACHKINISKCEMLRLTKVIVVGDVAVGKTCLVRRFCLQAFDTNYKATIGVDFEAEKFYILGVPYILQLWDTAGQEKFKCIASSHYKGARGENIDALFQRIASVTFCEDILKETADVDLAKINENFRSAKQVRRERKEDVCQVAALDLQREKSYLLDCFYFVARVTGFIKKKFNYPT
nr:ras-related protein Rab-34-like isoform X9 [Parasteatoda tepidariorum]